ncbi:MAG: hypothetical protein WCJ95_19580, partial [Mariniphaga sp.]
MNTKRMIRLFWMAVLVLAALGVQAQADSFDADIMKLQQVNGSVATTNSIFPRLVAQLKQSNPALTELQWVSMKTDVFDTVIIPVQTEPLIPIDIEPL